MSDSKKRFSDMTEEEKAEAKRKAVEAAKRKAAEKKTAKEAGQAEPPASKSFSEMTEEEKAEAKRKAVEAAKRKAAEKKIAKEAGQAEPPASKPFSEMTEEEKAEAKRKAIETAKQKAAEKRAIVERKEGSNEAPTNGQKAEGVSKGEAATKAANRAGDNDEKTKAIAAAKAKAAAAKAKLGGKAGAVKEESPAIPSPNQPLLDKYVKAIQDDLGEAILEDYYINRLAKDVPTLVANPNAYYKLAEFLKYNEQLYFEYLSESHGTDFETHMEVYTHLYSYKNQQPVALKVKLGRENPAAPSLTPLWAGANWPEREAYDLFGIQFTGHPNLTRIMMPDDWVGYPMRKDYKPYDVEV